MVRRLSLIALLAWGCGNSGGQPDSGTDQDPPATCTAIDASSCIDPMPSYTNDVVPLLNRACNTTCHAPGVGPWPLTSYQDVDDWASIIAGDIQTCAMPPLDAGAGNGSLSDSERAKILDWIACGSPNN